jgi:hypothetical protein
MQQLGFELLCIYPSLQAKKAWKRNPTRKEEEEQQQENKKP